MLDVDVFMRSSTQRVIQRAFPLSCLAAFLSLVNHNAGAQVGGRGQVVHKVFGQEIAGSFGYSCAFVGDIDGDGLSEWSVGAVSEDANGFKNAGSLRVYAGSDSSVMYEFFGKSKSAALGVSTSHVGDVDSDGVPDILVGSFGAGANTALVFSGADGSTLFEIVHPSIGRFGEVVAGVGDLNSDGHADFAVASPLADSGTGVSGGIVVVFSGIDGSEL